MLNFQMPNYFYSLVSNTLGFPNKTPHSHHRGISAYSNSIRNEDLLVRLLCH